LAKLLTDLADAKRAGQPADVEALAAVHPAVAEELRALWAAAQVADTFARPAQVPPPAPSNLPRSFGDYEVLEELGRGGMGVVYRACHRRLQRLVALKMVLRGEFAGSENLARFEAEARAAAHLDHPHIIPVYDAGECDGRAYFSM